MNESQIYARRRCVWCSFAKRSGALFRHPISKQALYACCLEHSRRYCRWVVTHRHLLTQKNPRGNQ